MKQKFLCLAVLCLPLFVFCQGYSVSQDGKGVQWVEGLSWQQVKQKAKEENKYIFVDCYATWCKPCKAMDKEVYTVDSVADYLNAGFISVKLQMDATANDNADVKSWYKTANEMESSYRISAYPSYIFFASGGEVVTKETGYKDPGTFIQVARNATDPSKQYYVLLKKYKQGKLDNAGTVSLINMAQQIGDTTDYRQLLNSYYAYLHKQNKEKLYTKENVEFIASTLDRSNMVLFDMFYPNGKEVNKVMQNDWYSKKVVDKIINAEIVQPVLQKAEGGAEADWNLLYNSIKKAYGSEYAGRNVLLAKIDWYFSTNNEWFKYATALNDMMEKYGTDTTDRREDFKLNNKAMWVWEHVGANQQMSNGDIKELSRTCSWMEGVVRRGGKDTTYYHTDYWPLYMDTYASLLYKTGRTAEAINWEELALSKGKEYGIGKGDLETMQDNLDKMKKKEPNWPIKEQ